MDTPSTQGHAVSTLDIPIRLLSDVPYRNIKKKTRNYDPSALNLYLQCSRRLFMEHRRWAQAAWIENILIEKRFTKLDFAKFTHVYNTTKMKKLLYIVLVASICLKCSTEEQLAHKPYEVNMKFQVIGGDKVVAVKFIYNNLLHRYTADNNEIGEIKAVNESTKEIIYVYYLKTEFKGLTNARWEIKTGYYGYSASSGCYIWGTLYVGDNGGSIFVPATGINAILNPPLCGYYYA